MVEERMSVIESPVGTEEFVREAFKSYVQGSGDGVLRISDLHDLFRHLGHSYSARQLEVLRFVTRDKPVPAPFRRHACTLA